MLSLIAASLLSPALYVPPAQEERGYRRIRSGSRIAREGTAEEGGVATQTGVQGLGGSSGIDPSEGGVRKRVTRGCKVAGTTLSDAHACALRASDEAAAAGDYEAASAGLDQLLALDDLAPADRYMLLERHYRIAQDSGDAAQREARLAAMVDSGLMPPDERPGALRALVTMALAARAEDRAATRLGELLTLTPDDARSHANLAALHQRAGRRAEARTAIGQAIEASLRQGQPVPEEWQALASSD